MLGIPAPYWTALLGALLWLAVCFQLALGLRWIKLGRARLKVHKWIGIALVVAGPLHGLWATSVIFGWPFRMV
jgi:formate-dependent nitrite reductase membrane component NrfD